MAHRNTVFSCVLLDPPWNEHGGGRIKRGADRHYALLKVDEIIQAITTEPAWNVDTNGHCWMWATNNHLKDALFVMEAIGFRYVTNAVWVKDRIGLGQYLRGQHELLLFGVRGRLKGLTRSKSTVIEAPRREHSRKPDESYELIEAVSPGPRLELFARHRRIGWTCIGEGG